jgi:tRNA (pseudouridine54-N1)-methyltransferase
MRIFVIKSNTSCIDSVNPRSPASSGRLDVVLDFIIEALALPRGTRRDTTVYAVLGGCGEVAIKVPGGVDELPRSEGELALAIARGEFEVRRITFSRLIMELMGQGYGVNYLHENGEPVGSVRLGRDSVFIVGDQRGLGRVDEEFLRRIGARWISLGRRSYLAWQCAVILNYIMDHRP